MSIAKPFTFVANTYAKASEVNANFDTVYSQVNTNISNIAQNATDIDNLENNKADVNGSASQRFAVADAVTSSDAINKNTLMNAIGNSIEIISGLIITKDSGSPDDTIIVSEGSCYDSTHEVVLSLNNSLSKQNLNQGANSTYYVYIIGNSSASQTDILISTEQVTPALPTGYSLFRQIGKYTTDGNSKISTIYSNSNTNVQSKTFVPLNLNIGVGTTSLSTHLPTDSYQYLVFLYVNYGNYGTECWISSDICERFCIAHTDHDSGRATSAAGQGVIPVGDGRTITCQGVGATIRGYMRI